MAGDTSRVIVPRDGFYHIKGDTTADYPRASLTAIVKPGGLLLIEDALYSIVFVTLKKGAAFEMSFSTVHSLHVAGTNNPSVFMQGCSINELTLVTTQTKLANTTCRICNVIGGELCGDNSSILYLHSTCGLISGLDFAATNIKSHSEKQETYHNIFWPAGAATN